MNEGKLLIIVMGVVISIVLIGAFTSKPTKYESYNEAIVHCNRYKSLNEQNACRAEVTKAYRELDCEGRNDR